MPRRFLNWTAEDVVRFLKTHGFVLNYTKGSHYFYFSRGRQVCVPFHGSRVIKPRTLKGIIRQSGIPKEIWLLDK